MQDNSSYLHKLNKIPSLTLKDPSEDTPQALFIVSTIPIETLASTEKFGKIYRIPQIINMESIKSCINLCSRLRELGNNDSSFLIDNKKTYLNL